MRRLTLLTVLAVALLCGCAETGTVIAGSQEDEKQKREPKLGSFRNPVPVGRTYKTREWEVTVLDVTPDATDIVLDTNIFNEPPKQGRQFYIAKVGVQYIGNKSGDLAFGLAFKAVGKSSVVYTTFNPGCGVVPNGLDQAGELFPGGKVKANVCWSVRKKDAKSLVMILEPDFVGTRVFFGLG